MVTVSNQAFARRTFRRINWSGLAVCLLALVLWQLAVSLNVINYDTIPGPIDVVRHGFLGDKDTTHYDVGLIGTGELKKALIHTLGVVLKSWAIAVFLGVLFGLALGLVPFVAGWTMATVDLLRSLPVIAFIPIVLLIWGPTAKSEIYVATWAALWPMLINTAGAVRSISPRLRDVSRTFQLSTFATLRKIVMPAIGGSILVGARLAMAVALVVVIVFEIIGNPFGLGYGIFFSSQATQYEQMWAYTLTVGILGLILNAVLVFASRRLFPGVSQLETRDM